ncbi:MAG: LysR family transcriptional regulator [Sphingopyxis sp.]|nr:LysR family transcriptional regulator [Sphingopyxis sp.]
MNGITLSELRALDAVAEHGSFRAASTALGSSTSSLSHAVAGLEKRLGLRLFNRTTRSVALTEAGRAFLDEVRPALERIKAAVEGANSFRAKPAGTLRLNSSEAAFERIMDDMLTFLAAYPDMRIDAVCDGRLVDIVADGFDAGLRLAEAVPQDMVALPLGRDEQQVLVASPAYLEFAGRPNTPADLAHHECIRFRHAGGSLMRWELERDGTIDRLDPPGRLMLGGDRLVLDAAIGGAGIAFVTAWAAEAALADGRLQQILPDWSPPYPGLCLYYPKQRAVSAGLRAFVEHVKTRRSRERIASLPSALADPSH